MKNFKKVLSGFVALTMAMSANVISANASGSYLRGDVDGNGTVDLIDTITLVQFLNGSVGADGATAERMDVHRDYVINEYDRITLSSILLGDTPMGYVNSANTTALPYQESRTYYKYEAGSDEYDTYTLDPVNNIGTRSIIGNSDDRYIENGLEGVLKVEVNNSTAPYGTAFIIDSHTIMTAAHVVYDYTNSKVIDNLRFKIYDDYNSPSNVSITPKAYHIPSNYVNNANGMKWRYDYAIVTVEEDLSDYINFDLGLMRENMPLSTPIYATGFGGNGGQANQSLVQPSLINVKSTGVGTLSTVPLLEGVQGYSFYHSADLVAGVSGGPTYICNSDGSKTVIGIVTHEGGTFNQSVRITTDILHFAYNNTNL